MPKGPDYNYSAKAMHAFLPEEPIIDAQNVASIEAEHAKRLRSLLSVDDIVRELYAYLVSVDEWKQTYFFYTSVRTTTLLCFSLSAAFDTSTSIGRITGTTSGSSASTRTRRWSTITPPASQ